MSCFGHKHLKTKGLSLIPVACNLGGAKFPASQAKKVDKLGYLRVPITLQELQRCSNGLAE